MSIATASLAGAILIIIQPVEPSVGREYIGRIFAICVLGGMGSLPGTVVAAMLHRYRRKPYRDILRSVLGARRIVRVPVVDAGGTASRPIGTVTVRTTSFSSFVWSSPPRCSARPSLIGNDYVFFAGYVVLQYIVLSTAWNILGGYTGYVNFGIAAFFALGAYSTVALYKVMTDTDFYGLPLPVLIVIGGAVSGIVGFGMGYLTLRLRGAFFAIATLALAVVLQTLVINWDYVGGSRGAYILRPGNVPYHRFLYQISVPDHAAACCRGTRRRAPDRALAARLRSSRQSATMNWRRRPPACRP